MAKKGVLELLPNILGLSEGIGITAMKQFEQTIDPFNRPLSGLGGKLGHFQIGWPARYICDMSLTNNRLGARMERFQGLKNQLAWLDPSSKGLIVLFVVLAAILNISGWSLPLSGSIERALYDIRQSTFAPAVEKDERLALVIYDDETARVTGKRQPLDRKIIIEALQVLDELELVAIGLDFPLETPLDDDQILIDQLNQMKTRTVVGVADRSFLTPDLSDNLFVKQKTLQDKIVNDLVKFGNPIIRTDRDNVVRNWPMRSSELPLFSEAMLDRKSPNSEDARTIRFLAAEGQDSPVFDRFSIDFFGDPATGLMMKEFLKDRYVIIGTDFIDMDRFETSISAIDPFQFKMTGTEIQAHLLSQHLDNFQFNALPGFIPATAAVLLFFASFLIANSKMNAVIKVSFLTIILTLVVAAPFAIHYAVGGSFDFPAFGWIFAWVSGIIVAWIIFRETQWQKGMAARSALGRYLPKDVASTILNSPDGLNLASEKRLVYTLFTDLEGFTSLCHRSDPDIVAEFLNEYLESLSGTILSAGGTVDKFVGDAVVGIWGAPIAKENDGERALGAAVALYQLGESIRSNPKWKSLNIGRTRVGLHFGEAIVGNFGGEGRIQYTALGDTMNVAARLEAANKELGTKVLISGDVAESVGGYDYRPMGPVQLRGRDTPIVVFEPNIDNAMDKSTIAHLGKLLDRINKGDFAAHDELMELSAGRPDDVALNRLAQRLRKIG